MSVFSVVAEPHRRQILDLLRAGQLSAGEIQEQLDLSQPGVSKHLKILREAELVEVRLQGRQRVYSLRPEPLQEITNWLDPYRMFWASRFDRLEDHLKENP